MLNVSLITVTFNSGKTLSDTIESVLSQSYPFFEYIIVDGLSSDNTVDIIERYESRFCGRLKWISEKDLGLYDAMNKGIDMATGDVIGILNSDDLFVENDVLEVIVKTFDDDVDAVFGNLYFVKSDDLNSIVRIWEGSSYSSFKRGWHPAHPTFYVKRNVYEKYGVFDTSFCVSADFELMLRFIEKHHICTRYLNKYIVKMRVGGESTGSLINIIRGNRNVMRAFKKNGISVSLLYPIFRLLPKIIATIKYKISLRCE